MQVVDGDDLVLLDEAARERRPDEARAARDDDSLPRQSHAASLDGALRATLSSDARSRSSRARAVRARDMRVTPGRDVVDDRAACQLLGGLGESTARCRENAASATRRVAPSPVRPGRVRVSTPVRARLFAPVSPKAVCTEIYGGPQKARVVGTVAGKRVWATFTRANGCHIERWNRLVPWLLPHGGVT